MSKRILSLLLVLVMVLGMLPANSFAAGLDTADLTFDVADPAGYVTVGFVDNGIRPEDAAIDNAELYGEAVGTIIAQTKVPYEEGDSMAAVTVRLLDAMGIGYSSTGTVEDGFYLSSLKDFELNGQYYETFGEFDAGYQSGWCVRLNNWHINQSTSAMEVEDGDVITWLYTCQFGADVGADFSSKSAEITDVVLADSALSLVYDGESEVYTCEVPADIASIAFEAVLENYASIVTVTVDGEQVKYKPNQPISVTAESTVVISTELEYMDAADNNKVTTYTDSVTVQLKPEAPNTAPNIKEAYAEAKGATYIYSSTYVYIYMEDIFEDADGDALTYSATLNGEPVTITYNEWSKQHYIQFATKPAIYEYQITANDGKADSEVFTATCVGTSATITPAEGAPLIPNGNYLYYVKGSAENDTFALDYSLDVDYELVPQWYTQNATLLALNDDGTFTAGDVTSRQQVMVGVTYGKDTWGSTLYLGTKYIYLLPAMPEAADITAELAEHADNQTPTLVSNAFTGWYSSEFTYEVADPSICDIATSGTYGLSVTPKALGTTAVTATFKYDESVRCTFNVTVTGRSLQIQGQSESDDVIFEEGKTVQLEVLGAQEGETFTWSSSDESVATVDENGVVTVKKLGQTYITAVSSLSSEELNLKASMYLQVKEAGKVYLEDLAVTQFSYFGHISAKAGFNAAQLEYDWDLADNRYTYATLAFTPYFAEGLTAVLHYQVSGGEYQTMELTSGTAVSIANGLNPGENVVKIDVYPTDDADNVTTYTFHIFRPYNPSNTISRLTVYPNGETALAYPQYQSYSEGTLFQIDSATGEFVEGWGGRPSTGWSSSRDTYKVFIFDARTGNITLYPTFAYANQRVMIYVNGEAVEEAVHNWESKPIEIGADGAVITFHVNSEKYHAEQLAAGVEDPFAVPEKVYTVYVEPVTPLGIDAEILSAELSGGEFYKPGFSSSSYTISGLIAADSSEATLTFTVPAGIDVYKGSVSDANKLIASEQDADGNNVYTTTLTITGTAPTAYSTTNIILQVADEEGNTGMTQYAFTILRRGQKDLYPDEILEYLCLGSQYTNLGSYGTMPERTLKAGGGALSLGNFGGYIIYKYDTPIENDPNNPYGVDFVIYGNSFGAVGAAEPAYVQVSNDGETWYTLAGSDHFDDHCDWDYSMTYTNANGKSAWADSNGDSGEIYNYPVASLYPYFAWTEELEQTITVSGPRLASSAKDAYGSAAAVVPDFGYVDVNPNGSLTGASVNPYNHPGELANGGDMFDLDWAVDASGMPVQLESISYIRVATASSIYAGAIGEKSTEVTAVTRVSNTAEEAVGVTDAPSAITVNGKQIEIPENGAVASVTVSGAALTVEITAAEESNIYINGTNGAQRSYEAIPEKGILRIIVQEGEKEPYICYLAVEEGVAEANVNVTISNAGKVVLAQQSVTVADRNGNGFLDVDDALYAAHEAGYTGGAAAGYASAQTAWGLSVELLWGEDSGAFGYWLNNASCWSLEDAVSEGDYVVAFVYQDPLTWSDSSSKFDSFTYTVKTGVALNVTLEKAGYDESYNTVFTGYAGADIAAYDSAMKPVDASEYTVTDNGSGKYAIRFAKVGTYYVIASDSDSVTVPAVCQVTVTQGTDVEKIYETTGDYLEALAKEHGIVVGSVGGEWVVIGLARSDREVIDSYYDEVLAFVEAEINASEQLHRAKSTENSRVILALTAIGKDVTDVGGHNLLKGLTSMAYLKKQGINGPIWALIAFDSGSYEIPEGDVTREALVEFILSVRLEDGGWALSGSKSDVDMTAMAIQSLAPYYTSNEDVKIAVDEALAWLSQVQQADGSYVSAYGDVNCESGAQVIVALTALGMDPHSDSRFVKNGRSVVDAMCDFYVDGGGFKHILDGEVDGMASEQGYYALAAYYRFINGKTSLYDMSDSVYGNSPFEDVHADAYYYDAVLWALEKGITTGKTETEFWPTVGCTREHAVTFLWRAAGCPEPASMENPFTDVPHDRFEKAILWAYYEGITKGKTATEFMPDETCTREQFVTFLYRLAGSPEVTAENPFTDVPQDQFTGAILWAYSEGITTGKTATEFRPDETCTRSQVVTFLYRYMEEK